MNDAAKFHHPYEPYDIQLEFMQTLYDCIEQGKIGIFESPTGTGKSLSLACASLTWLRDHKRKEFDDSIAAIEGDKDEPDWMVQHSREEKKNKVLQKRAQLDAKLEKIRRDERKVRERQENGPPLSKKRKLDDINSSKDTDNIDQEQFALDDYESDDEGTNNKHSKSNSVETDLGLSKETQALMQKLGYALSSRLSKVEDAAEAEDELKIFFCSRTHSQLTQFVNELRRIKLPPAIPLTEEKEPAKTNKPPKKLDNFEELKHLSLGSRKNLCINTKVSSLKTPTAVNERCLELQDAKTPKDKKCQFMPTKENEGSVLDFQHYALAKIRDIEDLGDLGKKIGICPYYATRTAIKPSEIITLPYPLLLQKSAREALGLSLKNHIVIIDEAHNLMDAITSIHTIEISLQQTQLARAQLTTYLQRFRNRLKGKNRVYVTQVVRLLDSISSFLVTACVAGKSGGGDEGGSMVQATELLKGKGVDQINLYKLMRYLQESKLARKVDGYVSLEQQQQQKQHINTTINNNNKITSNAGKEVTVPVLSQMQSLFMVLTNPAREGRLFYIPPPASATEQDKTQAKLKYMLLDPSEHFREIVEEARTVILAGGTMSPMNDYLDQLFPYLDNSNNTAITTLSCGHVIPPTNLFVSPIVSSFSYNNNKTTTKEENFTFTFSNRNKNSIISALGHSILKLLPHIPDGAVAFFPSYSYLEQVVGFWQKTNAADGDGDGCQGETLWTRMNRIKPIFKESQQQAIAGTEEDVLTAYTSAIVNDKNNNNDNTSSTRSKKAKGTAEGGKGGGGGAFLLAVIGGRLSEGINFSDNLGRCIMVIGLPFPNPNTAEWKAKTAYLEDKQRVAAVANKRTMTTTTVMRGGGGNGDTAAVGREFAENVCMRAVNQAIGRAVRHKDDWSAILLFDTRYAQKRISDKLPGWIRASLRGGVAGSGRLHEVEAGLKEFYARKKEDDLRL